MHSSSPEGCGAVSTDDRACAFEERGSHWRLCVAWDVRQEIGVRRFEAHEHGSFFRALRDAELVPPEVQIMSTTRCSVREEKRALAGFLAYRFLGKPQCAHFPRAVSQVLLTRVGSAPEGAWPLRVLRYRQLRPT
eukprot:ANDGO_04097.mRNA.1 hypothetical protein